MSVSRVKASVNSATYMQNSEDPNPCELTMTRVKSRESGMEARTSVSCKWLG